MWESCLSACCVILSTGMDGLSLGFCPPFEPVSMPYLQRKVSIFSWLLLAPYKFRTKKGGKPFHKGIEKKRTNHNRETIKYHHPTCFVWKYDVWDSENRFSSFNDIRYQYESNPSVLCTLSFFDSMFSCSNQRSRGSLNQNAEKKGMMSVWHRKKFAKIFHTKSPTFYYSRFCIS